MIFTNKLTINVPTAHLSTITMHKHDSYLSETDNFYAASSIFPTFICKYPMPALILPMKNIYLLSSLFLLCLSAWAQTTPRLVFDLSPGYGSTYFGASAILNNKFVFTASNGSAGTPRRLYITDGSAAGTTLLKELSGTEPRGFHVLGQKLFFIGGDATTGAELCVTDGTVSGTHVVKDIRPGPPSAVIGDPVSISGKLYFLANDGGSDTWLWVSDGTDAGTQPLTKIFIPSAASTTLGNVVAMNSKLYLPLVTGYSTQLFVFDPATETAGYLSLNGKMVDDVIVASNKLFFTMMFDGGASNPSFYLYACDGTSAGTKVVAYNIRQMGHHAEMDGKLYFFATNNYATGVHVTGLWVSDGTASGTRLIKDPLLFGCPGISFAVFRNKLYFGSAGTKAYNNELWVTDGTTGGTQMMMRFSGPGTTGQTYPHGLTVAHDLLYFKAWDSITRRVTLWASDGTPTDTKMVTNPAVSGFYTDPCHVLTAPISAADTTLFFVTNYDVYNTGVELYALGIRPPSKDTANDSTYAFSTQCYPNPVSTALTIDVALPDTGTCTITLAGIDGRLISPPQEIKHTRAGRQQLSFPMGHLPNGLYILQLTSGNHKRYHKIVVYH